MKPFSYKIVDIFVVNYENVHFNKFLYIHLERAGNSRLPHMHTPAMLTVYSQLWK